MVSTTAAERPATDTVLIVDDEEDLCRLVEFNLSAEGFTTHVAHTGRDALALAARTRPSVIILDLMLPDIPGTEVCRRLRAAPGGNEVAILMLTARGDEYDRVVGFELGTDDYVVKPFSTRELVLRTRTLARRHAERRAAALVPDDTGERLRWRALEMDPRRHRVTAAGEELLLRPMEFKLLATFLEHPGEVLSRARLLADVWGVTSEVTTRTVDTHVRRLRERLGAHGDAVETVHGFGYRLREP